LAHKRIVRSSQQQGLCTQEAGRDATGGMHTDSSRRRTGGGGRVLGRSGLQLLRQRIAYRPHHTWLAMMVASRT
jgi:hypothetical protein